MPNSSRDKDSLMAFETNGFCGWKNAIDRFKGHEQSNVHIASVKTINSSKSKTTIATALAAHQVKEMEENRLALQSNFPVCVFWLHKDWPSEEKLKKVQTYAKF